MTAQAITHAERSLEVQASAEGQAAERGLVGGLLRHVGLEAAVVVGDDREARAADRHRLPELEGAQRASDAEPESWPAPLSRAKLARGLDQAGEHGGPSIAPSPGLHAEIRAGHAGL